MPLVNQKSCGTTCRNDGEAVQTAHAKRTSQVSKATASAPELRSLRERPLLVGAEIRNFTEFKFKKNSEMSAMAIFQKADRAVQILNSMV